MKDYMKIIIAAIKSWVEAMIPNKLSDLVTSDEQLDMLIEADMLPAVHDSSGAILTDENGNIILRY